jgi:hypothetical protein
MEINDEELIDNHTLHKDCDVTDHDNEKIGYDANNSYITYIHSECENINHLQSNNKGFFCLRNTKNTLQDVPVV